MKIKITFFLHLLLGITSLHAQCVGGDLATPYLGGNNNRGVMFNIDAGTNPITINSFDMNLNSGATGNIEIYYKTGTYVGFETTPASWTLLGTATNITSLGSNVPSPIPLVLNLTIPASSTFGFYITYTTATGSVAYTNSAGFGSIASDTNITISGAVGKGYPFGATNLNRSVNCTVHYGTPLPIITTPVAYNVGDTATPLTATGTGLLWYTTATGGTGSTNAPIPSTSTGGATSYWVSQTVGTCESNRAQIDVIVTALPATHLNFDGVDDEINCSNSSSVQIVGDQISLEAMVKLSSFAPNVWEGNIINKEQDSPDLGYMLRVGSAGIVNFNLGNGWWNELNSPSNAISLNTWTHIAATYDGNDMKIYIDGVLVATNTIGNITIGNSSSNLVIGNWALGTGRNITGSIDEVRIWNRALSQAEIANNMNCELPTPTTQTGLVAYYQFNQGVSGANNAGITSITDSSVAASNGALTNMALTGATSNWISGSPIVTGTACSAFLGINDYDVAVSSFKMYPNPTHGLFKIESEFDGDFQIINQLGQTIKTFTVSANVVNEVVLDNVSSGIYFIKGINGNKIVSQKLIIN